MNEIKFINRAGTDCLKYDGCLDKYGRTDLLPLWVADMDFATPDFITDALAERIKHPVFGYGHGDIDLRKQIIEWQKKRHQFEIKAEWIIPLPSVKTGLNLVVQGLTKKGERVQIQSPVHSSFFSSVILNERVVSDFPLLSCDNSSALDLDGFDKSAKLFFLCNPQNPIGKCWSKNDLEKIGEFCLKHGMIIVSDEIHSDIVFHPHKHIPIASLGKRISDITITLNSAAKTFNLSGIGQAYAIIANPLIRKKIQNLTDKIYFPLNILSSLASQVAYQYGEAWVESLCKVLQNNRDHLYEKIDSETLIKMHKPEATYLAWLDFRALKLDHQLIESRLINTARLALSSGTEFRGENFFRLNFATSEGNLDEAINRLNKINY
jgi:cystathionine beta-lyase